MLVFGGAYHRVADQTVSATTLRRRRDAWIAAGVMEALLALALNAYDRMIGLALDELALDGCITKAPYGGELAGRSPVDRGKQGLKRSTVVDTTGIPLGSIVAPARWHDAPLLNPTLDTLAMLGPLPAATIIHLDRGYDSQASRVCLAQRGFVAAIARKGQRAPLAASRRWPVERTNAWANGHKKLVWCTERRAAAVAFWLAFSAVVIIVRRLVREGWPRYRREGRPARKP